MKRLRIILLVVLALLLPVRGAIGAAMLCPQGGHSMAAQGAGHDAHAMHHGGHAHADQLPHSDPHSVSCNVCVAFCSMTPMPSDVLTLLEQLPLASPLTFPALLVPAPTFQSDGPERPPRSV